MSEWLPMQTDLHQHQATLSIADATGLDPDAVVGKLLRVWGWARERTTNGKVLGAAPSFLDRLTGVSGFGAAMLKATGDGGRPWLESGDGFINFPKWDKWLSNGAKQRAKDQARKRRDRDGRNADKSRTERGQVADETRTPLGTNSVPEVRGEKVMVRGENTSTPLRGVGVSCAPEATPPTSTPPGTPRIHLAGEHTAHQHPDRAVCKKLLTELRWKKQERGTVKDDRISRVQLGKLLDLPGCVPVRVFMLCERVKRGDGKDNPAKWIQAGIDQAWECNGQDETDYREWYAATLGVAERLEAIRRRAV